MMNRTIGLVVALNAEAGALIGGGRWERAERCLFRRSVLSELDSVHLIVARSGMGLEKARAVSQWLIREGVAALVVSGVSGGLAPHLSPGDLVLADAVIQEKGNRCKQIWNGVAGFVDMAYGALLDGGIPAYRGPIISVQKPVLSGRNKEALFAKSKALAVDMESAAVATVARTAGLPFFALRAVCDSATRSISDDLFDCLNQKARVRLFHLLRTLLLKPAVMSELVRTKRDFATALTGLGRAWRLAIRDILPSLLPATGMTRM
jgi:adenosylhomocysteine nucleosidase